MPKKRSRSKTGAFRLIALLLSTLALCLALVHFMPEKWWWMGHLADQYAIQIAAFLGISALLAALQRVFSLAILQFLLAAWLIWPYAQLWLSSDATELGSSQPRSLEVFSIDLGTSERQEEALLELIYTEEADIVYLQDLNPGDEAWLNELKTTYPYYKFLSREGGYGIAVLSQQKWISMQVVEFELSGFPSVSLRMQNDGRDVELILTHLLPPMSQKASQARQLQAAALLDWIEQVSTSLPVAIMGPMYADVHSSVYKNVLQMDGLRSGFKGYGWNPDWPLSTSMTRIQSQNLFLRGTVKAKVLADNPAPGLQRRPVKYELQF